MVLLKIVFSHHEGHKSTDFKAIVTQLGCVMMYVNWISKLYIFNVLERIKM
jgi:hypothetical protein